MPERIVERAIESRGMIDAKCLCSLEGLLQARFVLVPPVKPESIVPQISAFQASNTEATARPVLASLLA